MRTAVIPEAGGGLELPIVTVHPARCAALSLPFSFHHQPRFVLAILMTFPRPPFARQRLGREAVDG